MDQDAEAREVLEEALRERDALQQRLRDLQELQARYAEAQALVEEEEDEEEEEEGEEQDEEDEAGPGPGLEGNPSEPHTNEEEEGGREIFDPTSGMNDRQKKLYELRQRLQQCRKANQTAVVAEKKKQKGLVDEGDPRPPDDKSTSSQRKWFEEKQKRKADELQRLGLDSSHGHRLETLEQAEMYYEKHKKKEEVKGGEVFSSKFLYGSYMKRAENVPYTKEDYEAAQARDPDLYKGGVDLLQYGKAASIPESNIDKMVAELTEKEKSRAEFSRRRAFRENRDVDSINDRNAAFNKKAERAFGKFTVETKANLERGTALPDR